MRRVLARLLIAVLCLPYLACAMPVCDQPDPTLLAKPVLCADHAQAGDKQADDATHVMLLLDCAGVDLELIQADPSSQKPQLKLSDNALAYSEEGLFKPVTFFKDRVRLSIYHGQTPPLDIILLTQRYRI